MRVLGVFKPLGAMWSFILGGVIRWLGISIVIIMAFFVAASTISRYLFNKPVPAYDTYVGLMMVVIIAFGASYVLRQGKHPKVGIVVDKLPPKVAAYLQVIGDFISLVVVFLLVVAVAKITLISFASKLIEESTGFLMWPMYLLVPVAFSLLAIEFTYQTAQSIKKLSALRGHLKGRG